LAISYLANLRPEIYFKLRDIAEIKTMLKVELIQYAAKIGIFSPLNPNSKLVEQEDQRTGNTIYQYVITEEYNTKKCVQEISKYAYATMEMIVYVMFGKLVL